MTPDLPVQPTARERVFNVPAIILLLVAVLGLTHAGFVLGLTRQQTNEFILVFSFIPGRYDLGLLANESWVRGWGAAVWSFVSYAFIHADLNHLFFNLVWLLAFGTPVARRFGALRFMAFFLVTAAAGAAVHLVTHWGEMLPTVGASASISAMMAAAMRFVFQRGGPLGLLRSAEDEAYRVPAASLGQMLRDPRALAFLLVWFGLNALFGLVPSAMPGIEQAVAWQAHIGGFLAGLILFPWFDPVRDSVATGDGDRSPEEPAIH